MSNLNPTQTWAFQWYSQGWIPLVVICAVAHLLTDTWKATFVAWGIATAIYLLTPLAVALAINLLR